LLDGTPGALTGVAGKYGNYKCVEAAAAMQKYLEENKKNGTVITLNFPAFNERLNYVWSLSKNMSISSNGIHMGVMYKGTVFCNIHPAGLPFEQWYKDFIGPSGYGIPIYFDF
jgi:hypothetical protein